MTLPAVQPALDPCLRCNGSGTEPDPGEPVPALDYIDRDRFRHYVYTVLRQCRMSDQVIDRILAVAGQYGAHLVEQYARPDERWRPAR
jgi:hypothetical protein